MFCKFFVVNIKELCLFIDVNILNGLFDLGDWKWKASYASKEEVRRANQLGNNRADILPGNGANLGP